MTLRDFFLEKPIVYTVHYTEQSMAQYLRQIILIIVERIKVHSKLHVCASAVFVIVILYSSSVCS